MHLPQQYYILCNLRYTCMYYLFTSSGDPPVVNDIEVFSVDANTLFISWDAYTSTNNCNFTLIIIDSYNSMDTTHLPCYDRDYEYTINNPDPCNQYNITVTVEANVSTCTDSRSVLISGIGYLHCVSIFHILFSPLETPAKATNLTAEFENNSILIVRFEVCCSVISFATFV